MFKDISGQRFGQLVAIKFDGSDKHGRALWLCLCDCGNKKTITGAALRIGDIKSCGCFKNGINHGFSKAKIYGVWAGIKSRCLNANHKSYSYYGGRGITLCDDWTMFMPFYEWAFINGYKEGLTIERIDVNGNYEPGNCKWATRLEQAHNTREPINSKEIKGVGWHKASSKWYARFQYNNKKFWRTFNSYKNACDWIKYQKTETQKGDNRP